MNDIIFLLVLFTIAFLYSSVGHGGASGYLALMAIFGVDTMVMKSTALTLNLFVAGIAFISYIMGGHFKWRKLYPFLITSIPMAYLGANIYIDPRTYKIILGIILLIAVLRMLFFNKEKDKFSNDPPLLYAIALGALLGFFSGMIGIGGGIILTPLLLLLKWANVKEAAAASALFIFLNSASGLAGHIQAGFNVHADILLWITTGLIGGFLGSYRGSFKFSLFSLKYILAFVLVLASFKLFFL